MPSNIIWHVFSNITYIVFEVQFGGQYFMFYYGEPMMKNEMLFKRHARQALFQWYFCRGRSNISCGNGRQNKS